MLTRPAGHEADARKSEAEDEAEAQKVFKAEATMHEAEARKSEAEDEAEAQKVFKAEATMYEAEARHVKEQLGVYEHEDIVLTS